MEQAPRTSFIPKQGVGQSARVSVRRRGGFLGILSVLIILGSLLFSAGIYFYASYVERQLGVAQQELADKRQIFEPGSIEALRDLDMRIGTVTALLDSHVSPSLLLDALERTTQRNIQFTDFVFERRPSGNVGVEMGGIAQQFNTVALQADRFAAEPMFMDVVFGELDRTQEGNVTFKVNLEIAADALAYSVTNSVPVPVVDDNTAESMEVLEIDVIESEEAVEPVVPNTQP